MALLKRFKMWFDLKKNRSSMRKHIDGKIKATIITLLYAESLRESTGGYENLENNNFRCVLEEIYTKPKYDGSPVFYFL